MTISQIGPLQWQVPIVDEEGRPTPEFTRYFQQLFGNTSTLDIGKQDASASLTALSALVGTGFVTQTGANSFAERTITGTAPITVTNSNGVSGNPALTHDVSGVTAGTYGDATHVAQITVDNKGHITAASNVAVSGGGGGGSVAIVQYGSFVGDNPTLTLTSIPTVGNILVAVGGVWNGISGSNSPWVQILNTAGVSNDGVYAAYRAVTPADTSATISKPAIQSTSQGWNITIFEISGASYTTPVYDFFKEQSATAKTLNLVSMKAGSAAVGCFNTNSGNPSPTSIVGATAGTSVAGTATGGSPRRANPFSTTGLSTSTGLTVTVNYASAPTAITGIGIVFGPA